MGRRIRLEREGKIIMLRPRSLGQDVWSRGGLAEQNRLEARPYQIENESVSLKVFSLSHTYPMDVENSKNWQKAMWSHLTYVFTS
jgi:hypothetical protein